MRSARVAEDCARTRDICAGRSSTAITAPHTNNFRTRFRKTRSSKTISGGLPNQLFAELQLLERHIQYRVLGRILEIEMPPFVLVHGEAFGLHGPAKQVAMPALQRGSAGIIGEGARGHLVVGAGH